jgi:hypothetical protein
VHNRIRIINKKINRLKRVGIRNFAMHRQKLVASELVFATPYAIVLKNR